MWRGVQRYKALGNSEFLLGGRRWNSTCRLPVPISTTCQCWNAVPMLILLELVQLLFDRNCHPPRNVPFLAPISPAQTPRPSSGHLPECGGARTAFGRGRTDRASRRSTCAPCLQPAAGSGSQQCGQQHSAAPAAFTGVVLPAYGLPHSYPSFVPIQAHPQPTRATTPDRQAIRSAPVPAGSKTPNKQKQGGSYRARCYQHQSHTTNRAGGRSCQSQRDSKVRSSTGKVKGKDDRISKRTRFRPFHNHNPQRASLTSSPS